MPPAARLGEISNHPGTITGPGNPTVIIAGLPAVTIGDMHACAFPPPPAHPPSPLVSGSATVFIGGRPAARLGDLTGCGATVLTGATSVIIGG
ncbi:PAAR domain-containing protein [Thermosulfuriphilus sp.]